MSSINSEEIISILKEEIENFHVAADVREVQIKALGERVEEKIAEEYDIEPIRTEGVRDGRWAVIDYGDVIVHVFNDETRLFYHLERLWEDGGNLERYVDAAEGAEKQ